VLKKSTFFCTKREAYDEKEELTVVYGSSYAAYPPTAPCPALHRPPETDPTYS
jgi:hypothetical protein